MVSIVTGKILGLMIGGLFAVLLLTALGPTIYENLAAFVANGNLSTAEAALYGVVGIMFAVGVVISILKLAGVKVGKM